MVRLYALVPEELAHILRIRAALSGRGLEVEAGEVLEHALGSEAESVELSR